MAATQEESIFKVCGLCSQLVDESVQVTVTLRAFLLSFLSVANETLPGKICTDCYQGAIDSKTFKERCDRAIHKLQNTKLAESMILGKSAADMKQIKEFKGKANLVASPPAPAPAPVPVVQPPAPKPGKAGPASKKQRGRPAGVEPEPPSRPSTRNSAPAPPPPVPDVPLAPRTTRSGKVVTDDLPLASVRASRRSGAAPAPSPSPTPAAAATRAKSGPLSRRNKSALPPPPPEPVSTRRGRRGLGEHSSLRQLDGQPVAKVDISAVDQNLAARAAANSGVLSYEYGKRRGGLLTPNRPNKRSRTSVEATPAPAPVTPKRTRAGPKSATMSAPRSLPKRTPAASSPPAKPDSVSSFGRVRRPKSNKNYFYPDDIIQLDDDPLDMQQDPLQTTPSRRSASARGSAAAAVAQDPLDTATSRRSAPGRKAGTVAQDPLETTPTAPARRSSGARAKPTPAPAPAPAPAPVQKKKEKPKKEAKKAKEYYYVDDNNATAAPEVVEIEEEEDDDQEDDEEIFPSIGPYQCEICQVITSTKQEFVAHIKKFHKDIVDEEVLRSLEQDLKKSKKREKKQQQQQQEQVAVQKKQATELKKKAAAKELATKQAAAAKKAKLARKEKKKAAKAAAKKAAAAAAKKTSPAAAPAESVAARTCNLCGRVMSRASEIPRHQTTKGCINSANAKNGATENSSGPAENGSPSSSRVIIEDKSQQIKMKIKVGGNDNNKELEEQIGLDGEVEEDEESRTCQYCGKVVDAAKDLPGHYMTKTCVAKKYELENGTAAAPEPEAPSQQQEPAAAPAEEAAPEQIMPDADAIPAPLADQHVAEEALPTTTQNWLTATTSGEQSLAPSMSISNMVQTSAASEAAAIVAPTFAQPSGMDLTTVAGAQQPQPHQQQLYVPQHLPQESAPVAAAHSNGSAAVYHHGQSDVMQPNSGIQPMFY